MKNITLFPVMHRGFEQILIRFENLKSLNDIVKKIPTVKWSKTYKCWYMRLNEVNYKTIFTMLSPVASINYDDLKQYLIKRRAVKATELPKRSSLRDDDGSSETASPAKPLPTPSLQEPTVASRLSTEKLLDLAKHIQKLTQRK